jgi:hypothetical protein
MKRTAITLSLALCTLFFAGCSVSQKAIDETQKRVTDLKVKGVPDSLLSESVKYLYGTTYAKQKDDKSVARKSLDSAKTAVSKVEALYAENIARIKPLADSLVNVLKTVKPTLSSLQAKKIDSAIVVIDSFVQKNWPYQIEYNAKKAVAMLPQLQINEQQARALKATLPGEWVFTDKSKSDADKAVNAVETKTFILAKDGKATFIEKKKGQSSKNLKEDYEFRSQGTWDCLGDTLFLFITRFASVRQNFETLNEAGGKKVWEKRQEPIYDSTITDHSQDRWTPFTEMKVDFKQVKKY